MSETQLVEMNSPLYRGFVHPKYAQVLWNLGLKYEAIFFWKVKDGQAQLHTTVFDPDEIYSTSQPVIDMLSPVEESFAAYQLSDLELIIPDYTMERLMNNYDILLPRSYDLPVASDHRLPDAFAKAVLNFLNKDASFFNRAIKQLIK